MDKHIDGPVGEKGAFKEQNLKLTGFFKGSGRSIELARITLIGEARLSKISLPPTIPNYFAWSYSISVGLAGDSGVGVFLGAYNDDTRSWRLFGLQYLS